MRFLLPHSTKQSDRVNAQDNFFNFQIEENEALSSETLILIILASNLLTLPLALVPQLLPDSGSSGSSSFFRSPLLLLPALFTLPPSALASVAVVIKVYQRGYSG